MYFETHAHYDDAKFDQDRDELIPLMRDFGVKNIVNIGASIESSKRSMELSQKYDFIFSSIGVHPNYSADFSDEDFKFLKENLNKHKVVALGEMGLDYHYDFSPKEKQIEVFKKQLQLAKEFDKPVVIHSREACQDVFNIIKESHVRRGVIHAYSGSAEMAKEYAKLGFYIGIGGVVTFKNAKKLVDVVSGLSIENILIETDSPYLTPDPFRGQRNDSTKLKYVVEKISEIKEIPIEEVEKITFKNAEELFKIKQV